jgi:hypothetical protein
MPETTEQRQAWKKALQDAKPELERVGENVTIVYNANAPVLQWWRFDDIQNRWVEVANKRKTDPYHRQKFLEKGWRLSPPEDQVPVPAPAPIRRMQRGAEGYLPRPRESEVSRYVETGVTMTEPESAEEESVIAGQ